MSVATREADRVFAARLRRFLWGIVAAMAAMAVIDTFLSPAHLVAVYAPKAMALVALGVALRSLRSGRESSRAAAIGLATLSITAATVAATGALSGHVVPRALLLLMLCVGAAGFIPWGLRRQAILVFVTGASLSAMVWLVRGRLDGALDTPGLVLLAGLAISLFLARESDKIRNERRRAQRALDHRTSDLQSISDAMSRYLAEGSLDDALQTLHQASLANTQSSAAFIGRVNRRGVLEILRSTGLKEPLPTEVRASTGGEILDRVLRRGLPATGSALTSVTERESQGLPETEEPLHSFLGVPIRRGAEVVGMIGAANRVGGYSVSHTGRLELLAQTASVLFGNDDADRARREDEAVTTGLASVGRELMQLLDRPKLLDRMCELTTHTLGCDSSHTLMFDAEKDRFSVIAGYGDTEEEWESLKVLAIPSTMMKTLIARFDHQEIEEVIPSEDDWRRSPGRRLAPEFRVTSSLLCPLRHGPQVIGLLVAAHRGRPRAFDEQQKRMLEGIGRLASMALHNANLVEELARANDMRSEFIATMSHELRTPLNVVIGYGNMLEDGTYGSLSEDQTEVIQKIDRNARELHELISTTLDMTRLEAGRVTVEKADVDLSSLIDEVLSEVEPLRRDEVEVRCHVSSETPTLETDPMKLRVIVKNLVRNALKFTDHGSVEVRARPVERGVEICVEDTGIGIADEHQQSIFEAFRQLQPGLEGRGGVGLGLHIVRRLVELLDGAVRLESTVGEGSRFYVRLPSAEAIEVNAPNGHAARAAGSAS